MFARVLPLFASLITAWAAAASSPDSGAPPFSFHVLVEPTLLDPQMSSSPSGNYLLFNMYSGLLKYSEDKGLTPDGAVKCERPSPMQVVCELRERKWSNGT